MDEVATGTTLGPATLARLFRERAVSAPGDLAFRHPVGGPGREAWEDVSWEHAHALVARALADDGSVTETPARGVRGDETVWWLDEAAASALP